MTQKEKILLHLRNVGPITSMEAFKLYGATRLSGIIWYLKHHDCYDINSKSKKIITKDGYAIVSEYSLNEDDR